MTKTEKTFAVIREKCKQIRHGEWEVKLVVYDGEIVGFEQTKQPFIKFRATDLDRKE